MTIPSNLRVPFVAVEFDSSQANQGPALLAYRALLIVQKTSSGTAAADTLYQVTSADQVATLCGKGSLGHKQAQKWFAENSTTETWIGVLADNSGGVAAIGSITFAGPASAAGTLALYIGGDLVQVGVNSGDAATAIATALAAALPSSSVLPVTGAVDGTTASKVNITFRHKGTAGNDVNMRFGYQGESLPAGVTPTIVQLTTGATNPVLTNLIAAMGDTWFNIIALPFTDTVSLTALEAELADRNGPIRQIDGIAFAAKNDTVANLGTFGNTRNSQFVSVVATQNSPVPAYAYAAAVAGEVALNGNQDPARPLQTIGLVSILPPAEADKFTLQERNLLLYDGISTTKVTDGGQVVIERLITMYKTNAAGADDTAYLDVTTILTLMYLRYSWRTELLAKYPRAKLADDGTRPAAGQSIITPSIGRAEAILWFRNMEDLALVENFDEFKANLVVTRDTQDQNRLNFLLPPDLINQFIVGATTIQFRL